MEVSPKSSEAALPQPKIAPGLLSFVARLGDTTLSSLSENYSTEIFRGLTLSAFGSVRVRRP
jgi:hypothetical protein